jgi:predicted 2-oxoglutarate/Fe(II)-dependent dioxygenase YbiX
MERLLPGDPAPWFVAPSATTPRYSFASVAGRYILLLFPGPAERPEAAAALASLAAARAEGVLDDVNAAGFVIALDPDPARAPREAIPGLRVLFDRDLAISRAYGATQPDPASGRTRYLPLAMLLDPLLRVIATAPMAQLPALVALLRRLPPAPLHAGQESPAPVLLLPRVFEPDLCRHLIEQYQAMGGTESGFMVERDGKTIGTLDPGHKRRKDMIIADEPTQAAIRLRITRRILPEIRKAFQFQATRIERFIVACYDAADGGHFRAHRDNTTPGTAHRRFAVTINLNDGFDGGALWFPEFSQRRFRPPIGGAAVFSCSLLHEATPVTRGTRYATLPFLYDDAAAALREANQASFAP